MTNPSSASFEQLTPDQLNIRDKTRSNPFAWRGQFSPQLIESMLGEYAPADGYILDPFVGSGTVLLESARRSLAALGLEVNPAAATMARVYTLCSLPKAERLATIREAERVLERVMAAELPLLSLAGGADQDIRLDLQRAHMDSSAGPVRFLIEALCAQIDFAKDNLNPASAQRAWSRLRTTVLELPHSPREVQAMLGDARRVPLPDGSVNLCITSPPYINVFNYHQQYRKSMEALGWQPLGAARSEIGSNRKHRQNRLWTVVQYCLDMTDVLNEMARVLRPGASAIVVVGRESNVLKTPFYNGQLLVRLGQECAGFKLALQQERVFQNRFGRQIYEDILHFVPGEPASGPTPREIAVDALGEARKVAPDETKDLIDEAINDAGRVERSPMFDPSAAAAKSTLLEGFVNAE